MKKRKTYQPMTPNTRCDNASNDTEKSKIVERTIEINSSGTADTEI
jgi:hypothetical protein